VMTPPAAPRGRPWIAQAPPKPKPDRRSGAVGAAGRGQPARANHRLTRGATIEYATLFAGTAVGTGQHAARAGRAGRRALVIVAPEVALAVRATGPAAVGAFAVAVLVVTGAAHVARTRLAIEGAARAARAGAAAVGAGAGAVGIAFAHHVARRTLAAEVAA